MKLFGTFTEFAPNKVFLSITIGAMAGICYAMLIPIVISSLPTEVGALVNATSDTESFLFFDVSRYKFASVFFICCLGILTTQTLSQILLVQVGMDVTTDLRVRIYKRISKAPIADLERLGSAKLMATITTDVNRVVMGAKTLPDLLISGVSLMGILSYLLYLNVEVFFYAIGAILFGSITYMIPMYIGSLYFRRGRDSIDKLHEAIRGLIHGTKELKLNKAKRTAYFEDHLLKHEYSVLSNEKRGSIIVTTAINYGDLISFFVIGFVAFIFISYNSMANDKLAAVIMALLYLSTPVAKILNALPQISVANISLAAINNIFNSLPEEKANEELIEQKNWQTLSLRGIEYHYEDANSTFNLGPLDFDIHKGEVTFIIGGNGSGKSTLSKIISLYYQPTHGDIYFGPNRVTDESLNSCREYISAIFTDYYLFNSILGEFSEEDQIQLDKFMKELALDTKVTVKDGEFSTISLSDGQKKRLALLVSYIENRDMYLFDEWAADQDPMFKETFYHQILPKLKAQGKAVLVISHDDRYFDIADRVITLEEGKIKSIMNNKGEHLTILENVV